MNWTRNAAFINGEWHGGESHISVRDPATGTIIGKVPIIGKQSINEAIAAAKKNFEAWASTPAPKRGLILNKIGDLLLTHIDDIAALITLENGKPLLQSRGEVKYTASYFHWFAGEALRSYGKIIPGNSHEQSLQVTSSPVGVCALITPWNFPLAMLGRKMAAALAAGCTIVAKPAESTPFSGLALARISESAGLPKGVLNIFNGDPDVIGKMLCADKRIDKLSFTGSTEVGRLLMAQCAPTLKRLSMELGGNAPFLVFEDANIPDAVDGAMASKFRNSGQVCIASNRFLIQSDIAEDFIALLTDRVQALRIGNGKEHHVDIGPMINQAAVNKVKNLVDEAIQKGARLLYGQAPTGDSPWISPIVLDKIDESMAIWSTEIFGPVVAIKRFDTEKEALDLANDTRFGLAAYFFSKDIDRCQRLKKALDYGMIGVNTGAISTAQAPFGGVKQSGFGREGGPNGLKDYLKIKYCSQISR